MDFSSVPFATFLEESVKTLFEIDPKSIAIAAITDDQKVFTGYYHCQPIDKNLIFSTIAEDAMVDIIKANKDILSGEEE